MKQRDIIIPYLDRKSALENKKYEHKPEYALMWCLRQYEFNPPHDQMVNYRL